MSILDIQIVSASLTEIQAGLSASSTEVSWVQTAYLIAEVIAIPLSGFLSRALGTRLLFAISAGGFTLASFLCGFASSIEQMILWRAIQGFLGAGMIPTVFASAYTVFPRSQILYRRPDHRPGRNAGADHRPDGRRLHHRRAVMALAVLHQRRARRRHHRRRAGAGRFRSAEFRAARSLRLVRPDRDGRDFSARSNTCWRKGRNMNGCRTLRWRSAPRSASISAIAFFYRVLTAEEPIVDITSLHRPQFRGRLPDFVLRRHRPLRPDLYLSALSRRGARLQRADDRRDHVRLRRDHVPDGADRRAA